MKSSITKAFRKYLDKLPASVQEQADKAYELWQEDPYHNSLQFKRVSQRQPIYSARVSIDYRVLGLLEADDPVVGKDRIDWQVDPAPDLAIEIDVTSYTSAADFLPYRVPEVWLYKQDRLTIYRLVGDRYQVSQTSLYFANIALAETIATCFTNAKVKGMGAAINQLRQSLG